MQTCLSGSLKKSELLWRATLTDHAWSLWMPPQWFLLRVSVILFLLLKKQKIITYNTVESPSAVISMMSWVTEYLSMKKYHEGSPTLKIHSCSLTIRLLPCHLLVSIFIFHLLCTFTSAHSPLSPPHMCSWPVHEWASWCGELLS